MSFAEGFLFLCLSLGVFFFTLDKETQTTSWQSSWIPVCLMVLPHPDLQTDHLFRINLHVFLPTHSVLSLKTTSNSHLHYTLIVSRWQQQQKHNRNSMKSKFKSIMAAQPLFLIKSRIRAVRSPINDKMLVGCSESFASSRVEANAFQC